MNKSLKELDLFQLATRAKLLCPELNSVYVPPEIGRDSKELFIIGEAPGEEEEEQRAPFVGPAGQVLRHALKEVFGPDFAPYITNVVKYRPTATKGNRTPTPEECSKFLPMLHEELRRIDPAVVMVMGNTAGRTLSGREDFKITSYMEHSKSAVMNLAVEDETIKLRIVPCTHPSYILHCGGIGTTEWSRFVKRFHLALDFVEQP
jgi:uracil-DNA glycosylase family 4